MKQMKNKVITGIVCLAVLAGIAIPVSVQENKSKTVNQSYHNYEGAENLSSPNFEVHFIDVGQADSALILCDGEAMLIDGGTNEAGSLVADYIEEQDVDRLKYMIGTHPHEDHVGGLDTVMDSVTTETLLVPTLEYDSRTYGDILEAAGNNHVTIQYPAVGNTYSLGEAVITVLAPVRSGYVDTNNYSIVVRIDYGEISFLFTGDAEIESEYDMLETGLNLNADVLKAGHHGSDTSTSEGFIRAVCPSYAVISAGTHNSYGHPATQTIERLTEYGVIYYRTDELGTVTAFSDGKDIRFEINGKTVSEKEPESVTPIEENSTVLSKITYVINKNTKRFHLPECSSVEEMKEENRLYLELDREEILKQGYQPCQKCSP